MDKQKQIEEMAKVLSTVKRCNTLAVSECIKKKCDYPHYEGVTCIAEHQAEELYNAGYRKILDAVVILEEEMEQFAETFAKSPQMQKVMYGLIKAWKKETAEEISNEIEDILQVPYKGNTDKQMLIRKGMTEGLKMALEICKEITEGN